MSAYILAEKSGSALLEKLPLANSTLTLLSALDPELRNRNTTTGALETSADQLPNGRTGGVTRGTEGLVHKCGNISLDFHIQSEVSS